MPSFIKTTLVTAGALLTQSVLAAGECDNYRTSYDRTYCYVKLFTESDNELNQVYKSLRDVLKDEQRKSLIETQRAWMKYRDQSCEAQTGTINVDCNYDVNRKRTDYLRDRLRECRAGTCRNDMIASPSWE